jgi:multicomponent Na+:H+ antiporter subunit B
VSRRARLLLFVGSAIVLAIVLGLGLAGLPRFGHANADYGRILNAASVPERHITDVVTAVNFDYRGVDTMGEEFIFFAAVAGALLLLAPQGDETPAHASDAATARWVPPTSDAVRVLGLALVGPTVLFGLYVVAHGHLTPGGGFQGGVVLATGVLLVYLAGEYQHLHGLYPDPAIERVESAGAAGYVALGLIGLVVSTGFLVNWGPLGRVGQLNSAGIVPLINVAVGAEVGAGFVLLLSAFLRQAIVLRRRPPARHRLGEPTGEQP